MYQVQSSTALVKGHRRLLRMGGPRVGRVVLLLGVTSMFTDISSEMVSAVLPIFLVSAVGLTPLGVGVVDGVYQGGSALVRIASGVLSDRSRRYKEIAVAGYGLSAVCKLLIIAAGSATAALTSVILADRIGKGIRTSPRDAMISLDTPEGELGSAFGVHRALDTLGAMVGPVVAFGILAVAPLAFHALFVVSFCIALIGLAVLLVFVENPARRAPARAQPRRAVAPRDVAGLFADRRFRGIALIGTALGVATISDAFVYLASQRNAGLDLGLFPLLYVGTSLVYMLLAVPAGRLADRVGRLRVFAGGYLLLLGVYAVLLTPGAGTLGVALTLLLFGGYYAATDGVLMALASSMLGEDVRASGLGALVTLTNLAQLLASILFGAIWTAFGLQSAIAGFGVALAGALAATALAARRWRSLRA